MLTLSACGGISTGLKVPIRADEPETSKGKSLLSPERKRQITEEGGKPWGLPENRGNLIGILYIFSTFTLDEIDAFVIWVHILWTKTKSFKSTQPLKNIFTMKVLNPGVIHILGETWSSGWSQSWIGLCRTVVDSDWHFDSRRGSHLQSQSELYQFRW